MRPILATAIATLSLVFVALSQEDAPKAKVSSDPLTEEQIAVYRTALATLNVADQTETLDLSEDKDCLKGIDLDPGDTSISVVHRLDDRVTKMKKNIVLVNGELQQKKVEENDPQKLMKRAIDGSERVTEKQLDGFLREAFATGLFTSSEIAFDKRHQHAVLAYSFVCGGLCGHGNTIVLRRVGGKWKQRKACRSWIS
jgi:hypothetical protein